MTAIPSEIKNLKNLEILILNNNKISKIENLDEMNNLYRLELRSNRIEEFENLKSLENLKFLTLSCNIIKELKTENIGNCYKMEELCLFGNYLGNTI